MAKALDVLPQGEAKTIKWSMWQLGPFHGSSIDRYYKALALPDLVVKLESLAIPQEVGVVVFSQKLSSQADFLDSLAPASFRHWVSF